MQGGRRGTWKGSESTLGGVKDDMGGKSGIVCRLGRMQHFYSTSPIYPKWWEILNIFRSTVSQRRGCCCLW